MKISFDEAKNEYTVNMQGAVLLTNFAAVELDSTMLECDCISTVKVVNAVYMSPEDVTAWNLMFNKRVKNTVKEAK